MNWAALAGLAGGALGAYQTSRNNAAERAAAGPQPYENNQVREPWGPTQDALREAIDMARQHYDRGVSSAGPPRVSTSGIRGASPELRRLAQAMADRAMNSQFVPQMQSGLTDFLRGPNPMMQGVYDRAMNYSNPMLAALQHRGMTTGFDTSRPQLQGFLDNLLGGQQRLGEGGVPSSSMPGPFLPSAPSSPPMASPMPMPKPPAFLFGGGPQAMIPPPVSQPPPGGGPQAMIPPPVSQPMPGGPRAMIPPPVSQPPPGGG